MAIKMKRHKIRNGAWAYLALLLIGAQRLSAQNGTNVLGQSLAKTDNVITTAVPFLSIGPDAREGGLGDAGVAQDPNINSTFWNPSELAFLDQKMGFSASYSPWLRYLVPDINLSYLSWFYKLSQGQTIGGSLRYFSLGNIEFTDNNGVQTGTFNPNEFAIDFSYSRQLGDQWSGAMTGRYIYSNLTGASAVAGLYTRPGQSFAVDLSTYYHTKDLQILGKSCIFRAGVDISNLGPKISYSNDGIADFLPMNLRLGPSLTMNLDEYNKLTVLFDISKLLVPTPPFYWLSKVNGSDSMKNGQPVIYAGMNPDVSVTDGIVQSFYDAPGGLTEELNEIDISGGVEYWYDNQFAFRLGFFYENQYQGGRQYLTMGAGFKLNVLNIDVAYLLPISPNNPLQNTLRLTLGFTFDKAKPGAKDDNAKDGDSPQ